MEYLAVLGFVLALVLVGWLADRNKGPIDVVPTRNTWWRPGLKFAEAVDKQAILTYDNWDYRISLHPSHVRLTQWKSNTDIPYASIASVNFVEDTCLANPCGKISVMTPGGEQAVKFHKDQDAIARWFRERIWEQAQLARQSSTRLVSTGSSLTDELERLGRLHASGLLDDAEFVTAKQRLME